MQSSCFRRKKAKVRQLLTTTNSLGTDELTDNRYQDIHGRDCMHNFHSSAHRFVFLSVEYNE